MPPKNSLYAKLSTDDKFPDPDTIALNFVNEKLQSLTDLKLCRGILKEKRSEFVKVDTKVFSVFLIA
jgi:hypothetical protein